MILNHASSTYCLFITSVTSSIFLITDYYRGQYKTYTTGNTYSQEGYILIGFYVDYWA